MTLTVIASEPRTHIQIGDERVTVRPEPGGELHSPLVNGNPMTTADYQRLARAYCQQQSGDLFERETLKTAIDRLVALNKRINGH